MGTCAGAHHIVMFNVKEDVTADEYTTLESSLTGLKQILGLQGSIDHWSCQTTDSLVTLWTEHMPTI